jgi:hypothetical protein
MVKPKKVRVVNPTGGTKKKSTKRRKKNPLFSSSAAPKRRSLRRKRNPSILTSDKPLNFMRDGALGLVGLVLTRQAPQMLLKSKNSGIYGYGANVVTTILAAAAAERFVGRGTGAPIAIGGGLYLVNRLLNDYVSPIGKYLSLSGVGDAQAASCGVQGLGVIRPEYVHLPATTPDGRFLPSPQLIQALQPSMAPTEKPSRLAGRFNN